MRGSCPTGMLARRWYELTRAGMDLEAFVARLREVPDSEWDPLVDEFVG